MEGHEQKKEKDEARGTWSRACALHRGPAGPALVMPLSESFVLSTSTGVIFIYFAFLLSSLAGWVGGMYALALRVQ